MWINSNLVHFGKFQLFASIEQWYEPDTVHIQLNVCICGTYINNISIVFTQLALLQNVIVSFSDSINTVIPWYSRNCVNNLILAYNDKFALYRFHVRCQSLEYTYTVHTPIHMSVHLLFNRQIIKYLSWMSEKAPATTSFAILQEEKIIK